MLDCYRSVWRHDDRDRVDSDATVGLGMAFTPRRGESSQASEFVGRDRLQWMPEPHARPGFYLDESELIAVSSDDVYLAQRAAPVAVNDG